MLGEARELLHAERADGRLRRLRRRRSSPASGSAPAGGSPGPRSRPAPRTLAAPQVVADGDAAARGPRHPRPRGAPVAGRLRHARRRRRAAARRRRRRRRAGRGRPARGRPQLRQGRRPAAGDRRQPRQRRAAERRAGRPAAPRGAARRAHRAAEPRRTCSAGWPRPRRRRRRPAAGRGRHDPRPRRLQGGQRDPRARAGRPAAGRGGRAAAAAVGTAGTVARLGGDEFAVLLPDTADEDAACCGSAGGCSARSSSRSRSTGWRSRSAARSASPWPRRTPTTRPPCSSGPTWRCTTPRPPTGGLRVYEPELDTDNPRRLTLVSELRAALQHGEIEVHVQPQGGSATGRDRQRRGAGPLGRTPSSGCGRARRVHPDRRAQRPDRPADHARCSTPRSPRAPTGGRPGIDLGVAVNLSARSLHDADLVDEVARLLRRHGVPAERLTLEVTESSVMADPAAGGRAAAPAARPRRPAVGRRLRHRLLVAVLPQAPAGARGQDRPQLRHRRCATRARTWRSSGRSSTSAGTWAWRSSPRASRTRRPGTCWRRWAATSSRAGTSPGRCRPESCCPGSYTRENVRSRGGLRVV